MLLIHATLVTLAADQQVLLDGALLMQDGLIAAVGDTATLRARYPDEELLDADGMLAMPGMICTHTHFYRALSRGLGLGSLPTISSVGRLSDFWWSWASLLGYDEIRYSTLIACIEAIRSGTTMLFDHHASPNAIPYSLDAIAEAVLQTGVRANLAYAVSDRAGTDVGRQGVEENARFARRARNEPLLSATMGIEACLYVTDESLRAAVGAAGIANLGYHVIAGESMYEQRDCQLRYGQRAVERLRKWGVLGRRTLAAHGVHLSQEEVDLLARSGTWLSHNPRSNMLEVVGRAPVAGYLRQGISVGLGTDGFSQNVLDEMQSTYLLHRHGGGSRDDLTIEQVLQMATAHNAAAATHSLGATVGVLTEGALADVILLDYQPPTPLTDATLPAHLLLGFASGRVDTTIVAGRALMRHGRLLTVDPQATAARSRELAARLWERI